MILDYAGEKLYAAISNMAVSSEIIQKRVCDAYVWNLIHVRTDNFPPEIAAGFAEIAAAMSTRRAVGDEGGAWASCSVLTDEEASALARKIFRLWERVETARDV